MKLIVLLIVIIVLYTSLHYTEIMTEGFEDTDCTALKDCASCADAAGCSWCPKKSTCVYNKKIKGTDECNLSNVISASEQCKVQPKLAPLEDSKYDGSIKNISIYDTPLYKNNVNSYLGPPIFTTEDKNYSNEDVVSNINKMREDIRNLKVELPGIVQASIANIQKIPVYGFEEMNPLRQSLNSI